MGPSAVLHVTALLGGGVDRHVRDIARSTARPHITWHVGEHAEVIEARGGHAIVLDPRRVDADPDAMARWLASRNVGLIHAHSLTVRARERVDLARSRLGAGLVATLHDVLLLRGDAFEEGAPTEPDPAWLAGNAAFLRTAQCVVAPSEFIAGLARRHIDGLAVDVIPNGSDAPRPSRPLAPRPEFSEHRPRHVVAVLGAIGPHKGAEMLEALGRELAG